MKWSWTLATVLIGLLWGACSGKKEVQFIDKYPEIYPDYTDVDIPFNIAPLNFMITDSCERLEVKIKGKYGELTEKGAYKISFPVVRFHNLLNKHKGDSLQIQVFAKKAGGWKQYKLFYWYVTPEKIDPFLTYRLIEPGYEVYNNLSIRQRNITNFDEKVLADNNLTDKGCMNCHITNKHQPEQSFFHIRHKKGGTIIAQGEKLRKLNTSTDQTLSAGVYGNWHPSGRFIAFSTNVIIPEFYSMMDKRMEVYDTVSDLMVLDINKNQVFSTPEIARPDKLESFPEFSADGKKLFFCVADTVTLPENYKQLKYSLCSVGFNADTRTFDNNVDTLFSSQIENKTVSLPKTSPDGRYLMFSVFDYGTFPIWHSEAVLYNLELSTGELNKLPIVNEKKYSNSYHSWSSNSHWFVFASKRDNGMYGKPYFSYINENGEETKPIVLPQKDPEIYDYFYKSFNIPELLEHETGFNAIDVERVFEKEEAEKVKFIDTRQHN